MKNIGNLFMRLAVVWFAAGVALGIGMGASHNFAMMPVHVHINLLGWVSMTLFAAFYRIWPQAAEAPLARWHFWLYVPAHLVMMATLALLYGGMAAIEPVLALSTVVIGAAVLCFAVLVWKHTGAPGTEPSRAEPQPVRAT